LEIRIVEERKNPLLHRVEYRFEVAHASAASPKRGEVRSELAKMVKVPKERLIVERMNARFGIAQTVGLAVAYDSKEALDVTVREHILVRNGLKEKAAAQPPGAAAEATPAPAAETPAPPKKEA
jgi:ribosomal protein S24E